MLDDGSPTKHSRNIMMASLVDTYTILGSSDTFLPEHSLAALDTAVYDCLSNYCFLAHVAMTSGQVRYNVVQKHHMMCHVPGHVRKSINARLTSAYTEESFVGQGMLGVQT